MRILLVSGASYEPPRGGSTRSNRAWLEYLAKAGHECRVVASGTTQGEVSCKSVRVFRYSDAGKLRSEVTNQIKSWRPEKVLVSTEDVGQQLLLAALAAAPDRVVYLAHTPQLFPFGPASLNPNAPGTNAVKQCSQIIAIGRFTAEYIERYTGKRATIVHPPMYTGAQRTRGEAIGFINPCAVKGLSIFVALAKRFPRLSFLALPGWGTTTADLETLAAIPNVNLVPPVPDIQQFFARVRILLVPSLWPEGFGLVATEAMLRGVPVLASDFGGLPEAKLGVPYLLPVRPIEKYETRFDEVHMPIPVLPEQNLEPWVDALQALLGNAALYEQIADDSTAAARRFVEGLDAADIERALLGRMRILLVQNSQYYPAFGGGNKSNRLLMEALAAKGHRCRVVTRIDEAAHRDKFLAGLQARHVEPQVFGTTAMFGIGGVEVRTELEPAKARERWSEEVDEFSPDWTLVSSDDPAQLFLDTALEKTGGRVVYLARTTLALPFGPDAAFASTPKTESLRRTAKIVGVSQYVADYVKEHSGIPAVHVSISLQDIGPFACFDNFDTGAIAIVNPCDIKGLPVFLELARRCPEYRFLAVPTWGTTDADLAGMRALPNIEIVPPQDNIDNILKLTSVMLVPSLWAEARSRIVVESLLRGVPVLASNTGGIPEAMMGLDYVLPVNPIKHYKPELDEQMVPVADVPPQDVDPWERALRELLGDREGYRRLAAESRRRALHYVETSGIEGFESLLLHLQPTDQPARVRTTTARVVASALPPEKRSLLAARLLQKRRAETAAAALTVPKVADAALSYAQERLIRSHNLDPDHNVHNVVIARAVTGNLDREWLADRLNRIAARHAALRTSFVDGRQQIAPSIEITLAETDDDPTIPFDLTRAPLWRASLTDRRLTITVHHAISDGWSSGVFARELLADGPAPAPYPEWVEWQRTQVDAGVWDAQKNYWHQQLAGTSVSPARLPFEGGRVTSIAVTPPAIPGVTTFAALLTAWAAVAGHHQGGDEFITGTPVANRRDARFAHTIGLFANTLALRVPLSARSTLVDLAEDTAAITRAALANQDYPFELLEVPLPSMLFAYQNAAQTDLQLPGVRLEHIEVDTGKAEHDLRLSVSLERTVLQYRNAYVQTDVASRLLDRFVRAVDLMREHPQMTLGDLYREF